jgi:hypothetical protein
VWNILPNFAQGIWFLETFLALGARALELALFEERVTVSQLPFAESFQSLQFRVAARHFAPKAS